MNRLDYHYFLSSSVDLNARVRIVALEQPIGELGTDGAELCLTAQVFAEGYPVHTVPISTRQPSRSSAFEVRWHSGAGALVVCYLPRSCYDVNKRPHYEKRNERET